MALLLLSVLDGKWLYLSMSFILRWFCLLVWFRRVANGVVRDLAEASEARLMLQIWKRKMLTTWLLNGLNALLIYVVDFLVLMEIWYVLKFHIRALGVVDLLRSHVRNWKELRYVFILVAVLIGFGLNIAETLLPALHWWNSVNLLRSFQTCSSLSICRKWLALIAHQASSGVLHLSLLLICLNSFLKVLASEGIVLSQCCGCQTGLWISCTEIILICQI